MLNRLLSLLVFVGCLGFSLGAVAGRVLPPAAKAGEMTASQYPEVKVDGTVYRLAPGAVLFDQSNRAILPGYLPQAAKVFYLLDMQGQISKLWIMTPEEAAASK